MFNFECLVENLWVGKYMKKIMPLRRHHLLGVLFYVNIRDKPLMLHTDHDSPMKVLRCYRPYISWALQHRLVVQG
jgi:hypothetical protein